MVNAKINGKAISVAEGTSILEAAKQVGIEIPTLCYLKEINEIAACRMCVVEIEGKDQLVAACNTTLTEGMSILTDSKKVINAREANLKFALSQHDYKCATCIRNANCTLQSLAKEYNIIDVPFKSEIETNEWDKDFPVIRDNAKCIKCMRCVQICDKVQTLGVWDLINSGKRVTIGTRDNAAISSTDCAICGQCVTHCPTGALVERDDTRKVWRAINDEEKIVVIQVAPAVRAAWGDAVGIPEEDATVGKMVSAIRALGVDYVFDTDFTADLTIMEEGSELLARLNDKDAKMPMFTSCCPGWVRFMKTQYPDYVPHLSTAKSPQQMFGSVAKSYYAQILDVDPEKIFCVSIMPCTAKKWECDVPEVNDAASKDVDVSLTTRELGRLIRMAGVKLNDLTDEEFDMPLGVGSGAGVIFGATGGVMEAALRSAVYLVTGKNPGADDFQIVRGIDGIRRATVEINGIPVRAAIANGLGNARKLMDDIISGKEQVDFVEIMACPTGCAGGGGQPISDGCELGESRGKKLYKLDADATLRFSHENPSVLEAYEKFFDKPLGHKSHELLHTDQTKWTL